MNRSAYDAWLLSASGSQFPGIPGYTIKSILGCGGFSTVYLAAHHTLERDVALKVVDPDLIDGHENYSARFLREAKDTALVSDHPNIVTVYDTGRAGNLHYISMQYLPGANLRERIDQGQRITNPELVIYQLADALSAVHGKGFVHRDVKPANILFDDSGTAILSDFGVARRNTAQVPCSKPRSVAGTAHYMSPEQCRNEAVDARADLYSLGVVLFEILTGSLPFRQSSPAALSSTHLRVRPFDLPEDSQCFRPLLDKLLATNADQRFSSAQAVMRAIAQIPGIDTRHLAAPARPSVAEVREPTEPSNDTQASLVIGAVLGTMAMLTTSLLYVKDKSSEPSPIQTMHCPTLTESEQKQEAILVELAGRHEAVGRTTFPPGANALEAYTLALQIDPCNQNLLDSVARLRAISPFANAEDL